jgi:hypothetical protein
MTFRTTIICINCGLPKSQFILGGVGLPVPANVRVCMECVEAWADIVKEFRSREAMGEIARAASDCASRRR